MGMGDRLVAIVDDVAEALDIDGQARDELEQLIAEDPAAFADKYREVLSEDQLRLLDPTPPQ